VKAAIVVAVTMLAESFAFDGSTIAREEPDGRRIAIAGFGIWFFGVNPDTGRSAVVNRGLDVVFDPGDFVEGSAHVGRSPTGFISLTSDGPGGNDPLVTLIERCE